MNMKDIKIGKSKDRIRGRLWHVFSLATASQRAEGVVWYHNANTFAVTIAVETSIPVPKVVGVIAALSPSVYWDQNKRQAEALCRAYADTGSEVGSLFNVALSTYGQQARKAREILNIPHGTEGRDKNMVDRVQRVLGERAFKTRAFFENILQPFGGSYDVTVDMHIVEASGIEDLWTQSARWCYDLIADAITEIANSEGLLPHQVQAIIWTTWKDLTYAPEERVEPAPF